MPALLCAAAKCCTYSGLHGRVNYQAAAVFAQHACAGERGTLLVSAPARCLLQPCILLVLSSCAG
jgi:hypothetical protein